MHCLHEAASTHRPGIGQTNPCVQSPEPLIGCTTQYWPLIGRTTLQWPPIGRIWGLVTGSDEDSVTQGRVGEVTWEQCHQSGNSVPVWHSPIDLSRYDVQLRRSIRFDLNQCEPARDMTHYRTTMQQYNSIFMFQSLPNNCDTSIKLFRNNFLSDSCSKVKPGCW